MISNPTNQRAIHDLDAEIIDLKACLATFVKQASRRQRVLLTGVLTPGMDSLGRI
jgi:hypothetical protein